jgi:transposase
VAHLVTADEQAARCPGCELVSSAPKGNVTTRPRDLPYGGRGVALMWHKRRWRCKNPDCARSSFTESLPVVPARHRLTGRLRQAAGAAVGDRGAPAEQAGRELGLSWPTVMAAARDHAERVLPKALAPVRVLGLDGVRRGRRRWARNPASGRWEVAVDAWHVGFVDISGGQGLLGRVEGRTREAVVGWLAWQPRSWRDQVTYVAIDMSAVFASAIRQALPHATLVVDHFHVVQLANKTLGEVRRRVTWRMRNRRGSKGDGEWEVRNLLTRNMEDLSERRFARMWNTLVELGNDGYEIPGWSARPWPPPSAPAGPWRLRGLRRRRWPVRRCRGSVRWAARPGRPRPTTPRRWPARCSRTRSQSGHATRPGRPAGLSVVPRRRTGAPGVPTATPPAGSPVPGEPPRLPAARPPWRPAGPNSWRGRPPS